MNAPYVTSYSPPAPVVIVQFGVPGQPANFGPYQGLLDSGADMSIVPRQLLVNMGITARVEAYLRGQWSERRIVWLYLVDVQIGGLRLPGIYVAGDDEENEIILGRNVLNKLPLFLDGPQQQTDLLDDATAQRLRAQRESRA